MNSSIPAIVFGIVIFFVFQMILPFPYGIILFIPFAVFVIWFTIKRVSIGKNSLLNYRRTDPINEKEREQNDEAQRILEKKYLEEKISKKEYKKRKKEFEDIEYNSKQCKICGSEDFEFVLDRKIEEPSEPISDEGYYRCKNCGKK